MRRGLSSADTRCRVTPKISPMRSMLTPSSCRAAASARRTREPASNSRCSLSLTSSGTSGREPASMISVYDFPSARASMITLARRRMASAALAFSSSAAHSALSAATTDLLRDELSAHVRDASVGTVIVDDGALVFVDSTGIGTLVRARRLAEEHGTAFRVRRPAARLADLLERTGLTQLLLAP